MAYKYAYQGTQDVARGVATSIPISVKSGVMLAQFIRGKSAKRAERDLNEIIAKRMAVPFTRFQNGAGHKPGAMAAGKYPKKASESFLKLLLSVVANAQDKGMGDDLVVVGVTVHKAAQSPSYGRHRGRMGKSAHVEMVLAEADASEKNAPVKKAVKKAPAKAPKKEEPLKTETTEEKVKEAAPKAAKKSPAKKAATAQASEPAKTNDQKSVSEETQ